MKRKLLVVLAMLAGVCLLAYPHAANYLSSIHAAEVVESYDEAVEQAGREKIDEAWRVAVEYNENLAGNPVHDPFLEGSGMVMADNYFEVLDLDGTGIMGHVSIPKISVDLPVYHGTSDASLMSGAGHLEGSSMPSGGEGTHCVITGHSGLVNAKMFTDLEEIVQGDRFFLHILDEVLAYEVDQILVVEPADTESLKRVGGEDYCTLVTCTPYGVNSHRLLVRGHRVDYVPEDELRAASESGLTREQLTLIASAVGAAVGVVVVALAVRRRMRRKAAEEAQIRVASELRARNVPPLPFDDPVVLPEPETGVGEERTRRTEPDAPRDPGKGERRRFWWEEGGK